MMYSIKVKASPCFHQTNFILINNYIMYAILSVVIGICIGCSPLGNSRMVKIIVMALTGG